MFRSNFVFIRTHRNTCISYIYIICIGDRRLFSVSLWLLRRSVECLPFGLNSYKSTIALASNIFIFFPLLLFINHHKLIYATTQKKKYLKVIYNIIYICGKQINRFYFAPSAFLIHKLFTHSTAFQTVIDNIDVLLNVCVCVCFFSPFVFCLINRLIYLIYFILQ